MRMWVFWGYIDVRHNALNIIAHERRGVGEVLSVTYGVNDVVSVMAICVNDMLVHRASSPLTQLCLLKLPSLQELSKRALHFPKK